MATNARASRGSLERTVKMKCSVLLTHVNMMVDAWRRYKDTNVFVKTVTLELTVKIQILVYQTHAYMVEAAKISKALQAVTVVRGIMERTALNSMFVM